MARTARNALRLYKKTVLLVILLDTYNLRGGETALIAFKKDPCTMKTITMVD